MGGVPLGPDREGDEPGGQALAEFADAAALERQVGRARERQGEAADV